MLLLYYIQLTLKERLQYCINIKLFLTILVSLFSLLKKMSQYYHNGYPIQMKKNTVKENQKSPYYKAQLQNSKGNQQISDLPQNFSYKTFKTFNNDYFTNNQNGPMTFYRNFQQNQKQEEPDEKNQHQHERPFYKNRKKLEETMKNIQHNENRNIFQNVSKLDNFLQNGIKNSQDQQPESEQAQQRSLRKGFNQNLVYVNQQGQYYKKNNIPIKKQRNQKNKQSSKHPIFYSYEHLQQNYTQYHPTESQEISPYNSQKRIRTINNQSLVKSKKYLKYKRKYLQALHAIQKLQKLNETLINDQRKNYNIFQNSITELENVIQQKQQDIHHLNQIVFNLQERIAVLQKNQFELSKAQYQAILKENTSMKLKIDQLNATAEDIGRRSQLQKTKEQFNRQKFNQQIVSREQGQNKIQVMNSKIARLKKHNESLQEKVKQTQQTNKLYENMLKQKQKRITKLSQFNTSLSMEILKIKNDFLSLANNQRFSQVSIYNQEMQQSQSDKIIGLLDTFNPSKNILHEKFPIKRSIQKYISSVDTQINLIKEKIIPSKAEQLKSKKGESATSKPVNIPILKRTDSYKISDDKDDSNTKTNAKYLKELQKMRTQLHQIKNQVSGQSISLSTNSK